MYENLAGKVIGQDDAVTKIVKSIQRGRVGMKDPNKPGMVALMLGNTGTGKCFTKKTLVDVKNKKTGKIEKIDISNLIYKL